MYVLQSKREDRVFRKIEECAMSMTIFYEGIIYSSMTKFMLSEAIQPIATDYGTDLKNKEWIEMYDSNGLRYMMSFLQFNDYFYRIDICIDDGTISFLVSNNGFDDDKIKDPEWLYTTFADDRKKTGTVLRVFNKVLYIALQGIHKFDIKEIKFDAANAALGNVYERMFNNKFLTKHLEKYDIYPLEKRDGFYVYVKDQTRKYIDNL